MIRILITLTLITNIAFAQPNENFLTGFLLEDELKSSNDIEKYRRYDFSKIWTKTDNSLIYGIIGTDHQRIRIKLISITKKADNPNEYLVFGKSNVKGSVCDFHGTIRITEIKEVKELHFGIDDEYKNKGIKSQGNLIADFEFKENKAQNHSGTFNGQLYSKWYLDSKNQINYDNIESIADGYSNNAFIGTWKSYRTGKEKICNWADYRVPKANQDFDIGAGEFSVSEKYWNKGWHDEESSETKEWWK